MAKREIVYTAIGTCRIAEPLGAAVGIRALKRNNVNVHGFTHTSKEALQQIDCLGTREVPAELVPYLSPEGTITRGRRPRSDVFVVEISSVKEIVFGEWYLQINYLERAFRTYPGLIDTFFQLKGERDESVRIARLAQVPSFAETSEFERRVLVEGYVRSTTRDELEADMAAIAARLPAPVIFVGHINVPNSVGAPIATRARLCEWLAEICREKGYVHFDPSWHVKSYGQRLALAQNGQDLNHYTTEFKPVLGGIIFDGAILPVARPAPSTNVAEVQAGLVREKAPQRSAVEPVRQLASTSPNAALKQAKKLVGEGDLDEAEIVLRSLAPEDGRSADVATLLGTIAFHRGDITAATAEFREAVERDPSIVEARLMLVKIALRMNRLTEAVGMATDLLRRAPEDLRILLMAAKTMMKARQFDEATSIWWRISMKRPELVLPLVEIARCELKSRHYEGALTAANDALARDPSEPAALVIKSDALQKLKRFRELAEVALQLASIDPRAAMAVLPILVGSHHPEEAAAIVATARDTGEVDIDAVMRVALIRTLERRGKLAEERGDTEAAVAAWKAILQVDPDSSRAQSGLRRLFSPLVADGRALVANGDLAAAVSAYEAALAIKDTESRILRELALVHEKASDWARASQRWSQLASLVEDGEAFRLRAARAAMRAKRYDVAVRIYQSLDLDASEDGQRLLASALRRLIRAMRDDFGAGLLDLAASKANAVREVDPDNEPAQRVFRKVMATYSRRLREATAAEEAALQEEIARKMLEHDPDRRDALRVLSKLYSVTRRHRDGIEVLQRLTEIEPDDTRNWIKLARSCRAIRLYDRGVPAALKALEINPGDPSTVSLLSDMLNRQSAA